MKINKTEILFLYNFESTGTGMKILQNSGDLLALYPRPRHRSPAIAINGDPELFRRAKTDPEIHQIDRDCSLRCQELIYTARIFNTSTKQPKSLPENSAAVSTRFPITTFPTSSVKTSGTIRFVAQ